MVFAIFSSFLIFTEIILYGIFLCEESIARIAEPWKCFSNSNWSGNMCIEVKIEWYRIEETFSRFAIDFSHRKILYRIFLLKLKNLKFFEKIARCHFWGHLVAIDLFRILTVDFVSDTYEVRLLGNIGLSWLRELWSRTYWF
jgi:hypothetical protein